MNKKKTKLIIVLGILLTCSIIIGMSYSMWLISRTQITANAVNSSCFTTTFTDENNINLTSQIPIIDSEGMILTPYTFTIKNTCNMAANYEINLESLETSTVDAKFIKISFNDENPVLLSSFDATATTINGSIGSYKLKTGYLDTNEEVTYNIRLWVSSDVKISDNIANKEFDGKVVVNTSATPRILLLASQLIKSAGGISVISAKTTPDFSKAEPVITEYKDNGFLTDTYSRTLSSAEQAEYYTYADSYTFDKATGLYSLVNAQVGKYSDIYSTLAGKYVAKIFPSTSSTAQTNTGITNIYKISEAPYNASTDVDLKYFDLVSINSFSDSFTSYDATLSGMYTALDDYGTSYYYRGKIDNNNVLFGGFCWKVIRINGNGTTRMIYNGAPTNGTCVATGTDTEISQSAFNTSYNDNTYVGYMYGTPASTTYEATHANINSSTAKTTIDNWYKTNLSSYASKISDTEFCNDRSVVSGTGIGTTQTQYGFMGEFEGDLKCSNQNDRFTVGENAIGNAKLTYPVGMITGGETILAGYSFIVAGLNYLNTGKMFWTMTPISFDSTASLLLYPILATSTECTNFELNLAIGKNISIGLRPVINLNSDVQYTSGDGTSTTPYIVAN
jgi:hypothetical protein